MMLPALASAKEKARRIQCASQLKQVGLAMTIFATDHKDRFPPYVPAGEDGSQTLTLAWQHYSVVSNELVSTLILVCPADREKSRAVNFSSQAGGFTYMTNRNNSLSYFMGTHAVQRQSQTVLAGDRHFTGVPAASTCPRANIASGATRLDPTQSPNIAWSPKVHRRTGNLGLSDGSVTATTSYKLANQLMKGTAGADDNGRNHALLP